MFTYREVWKIFHEVIPIIHRELFQGLPLQSKSMKSFTRMQECVSIHEFYLTIADNIKTLSHIIRVQQTIHLQN